jgi:O-antigen/teichoic acid export membrane protein
MSSKYLNNYILVSINTIANLILPIITFPYISRVIGAEYLGIINFATSYGYYFIHLASFGISSYAIRAVSKIRENVDTVQRVSNEIYNINVLFFLGVCNGEKSI